MRIAYLILAHKNWDQLELLIRTIKEDWNDVFVHVDRRSDFDEIGFRSRLADIELIFCNPRIAVHWGHVSIVHATLALLTMTRQQNTQYDRVVLLSGQCFPIVPNDDIRRFFIENEELEFIEYGRFPIRWWPFGGWDRVLTYNFPHLLGAKWNRALRILQMYTPFRRRALMGKTLFGASQWFNLTAKAVDHVLTQVATTDTLRHFNYTYCADEIFFQTILLNSPFAGSCRNRSLRYIDWPQNASGPKTLTQADYSQIIESAGRCLFARKFDMNVDSHIIDLIRTHNIGRQ